MAFIQEKTRTTTWHLGQRPVDTCVPRNETDGRPVETQELLGIRGVIASLVEGSRWGCPWIPSRVLSLSTGTTCEQNGCDSAGARPSASSIEWVWGSAGHLSDFDLISLHLCRLQMRGHSLCSPRLAEGLVIAKLLGSSLMNCVTILTYSEE